MRRIEKFVFLLFLFLIPTQLALHFWPDFSFVFGIRVDYLSPAIYLTDIFIFSLFVLNFRIQKKYFRIFLIIFFLALINTIFSTLPQATIFKWLKIYEMAFLAIYIIEQKSVRFRTVLRTLFLSGIFFSLIGIAQFFLGRTTGLFYFLGERSFSVSTPAISLVKINGVDFLRAYSTFSHPNSLAGFLSLVIIISFEMLRKEKLFWAGFLILALGLFLTFSMSAFFASIISLFLIFLNRKNIWLIFYSSVFFSLFLPLLSANASLISLPQKISQRLELAFIAGKMISEKFFIGEGLNTFILNLPKFKGVSSYLWFLQPVHNLTLLVFAETGILGLLAFLLLIYKTILGNLKNRKIFLIAAVSFILLVGTVDHYFITLQQNLILFSIIIGLSFKINQWNKS